MMYVVLDQDPQDRVPVDLECENASVEMFTSVDAAIEAAFACASETGVDQYICKVVPIQVYKGRKPRT